MRTGLMTFCRRDEEISRHSVKRPRDGEAPLIKNRADAVRYAIFLSVTTNRLPCPGPSDSAHSLPLCASTILCAM